MVTEHSCYAIADIIDMTGRFLLFGFILLTALVTALEGCSMENDDLTDQAIAELSATDLAARLSAGTLSAERVTRATLQRIAELDRLQGISEPLGVRPFPPVPDRNVLALVNQRTDRRQRRGGA